MPKAIDITGQRFGKLTAIKPGQRFHGHILWIFKCDCGMLREASAQHVKQGRTVSCGCVKREALVDRNYKHGLTGTPEHNTWLLMIHRCTQPSATNWSYYGGRGIKVCKRWENFENFLADMGKKPSDSHSIDRINNNGNYEPENCRWATKSEQRNNQG